MTQRRFIHGPIVIEERWQPDGSYKFEVWDNGTFSFHCIEKSKTIGEAVALQSKLTAEIARRPVRQWVTA